jgi:hypothetical protein
MKKVEISNLIKIKNLIKIYYSLEYGELIEYPNDLLPLFIIKKRFHPHNGYSVYISRRSLKHFVERRKEEFKKDSIIRMYRIIDNIQETIADFDSYEVVRLGNFFYEKDYDPKKKNFLRILIEVTHTHLEIVSMHLRKKVSK